MSSDLIQDCESRFGELSQHYGCGDMTEAQFAERVGELRVQDSAGVWWQMSPVNGNWMHWDGGQWIEGGRPPDAQTPAAGHAVRRELDAVLPAPPAEPPVRGFSGVMGQVGRYLLGGVLIFGGLVIPLLGLDPEGGGLSVGHLFLALVGVVIVVPRRWLQRRGRRSG